MKHLVKSLCALTLLGATGVLLLADSAEKCDHAQQSASFALSEGCGPAGTLSLSVEKDACYINVSGADTLQVTTQGNYVQDEAGNWTYDLIKGNWRLTGTVPYDISNMADAGWPQDAGFTSVTAARECLSSHEGDVMKLRCTDRAQAPSDTEARVLATCEATLTPQ